MGEVFRATDAKLKREAQLLAQLQHPCVRRRMAGTGFRGSPFADADRPFGRG